jgi:hypothetical protein
MDIVEKLEEFYNYVTRFKTSERSQARATLTLIPVQRQVEARRST